MVGHHTPLSLLTPRRRFITASVAATLAFTVGACGPSPTDDASGSGHSLAKVRFALDWTPNTNHTGLYVAINKGYFADAGINLEVVPYNSSDPDVIVDSGQAQFGIGFQASTSIAMAAGADLLSVLAVEQRWATQISVLADRADIQSPADLDGLVYGGFGSASEEAIMRAVIQNAGGEGNFDTVVLGSNAYEALYSGDVDFTVPFVAWEGVEAERRGVDLKSFSYTDYGFPDSYQVIVTGNKTWLKEHPDLASSFVQVLARGYEEAVDDPEGAAAILKEENSDVLTDLDFLVESQAILSAEYMLDQNKEFGRQTAQQWSDLGKFLFESGQLANADGVPLNVEPDWTAYFTNEYLDR